MKLKNISIFGFKTFAEQTSLDFDDGITAIVGPNGSGKSNLVDAIRWVLGEQSPKSLRSSKTEDVIFAGNEKRKPLGMTEVSLTFDNSAGRLPIEFSEVQLTRRAYRAGETEYYLNRNHVRLRDIMDLLVGTGLGSGSYAIVSQGEIDAILTSKPSERRTLFEETAGINRFLARKNESLRRLEQTQQNAIRISDLIAELGRRIPELDTQVRRANRYRKISGRLRDLEILAYLRASASRRAERERIRAELERNESQRGIAAARGATLAADLSAVRYRAYQHELMLEEKRSTIAEQRAQLAKAQAEFAAATAGREALQAQSTITSLDAARVRQERSHLEATVVLLDSRIEALQVELEQAHAAELTAESSLEEARSQLDAIIGTLRAAESAAAKAAAIEAERRVHIESARTQAARLDEEWRGARAQCEQADQAASRSIQRYSERERDLGRLQRDFKEILAGVELAQTSFEQASAEVLLAQEAHLEHLREAASAESRLHTIEELEATLEGHVPGTRAVVEAWHRGELRGVQGIVSNVIEVDERYARALDVAFGARLSNIITQTSQEAQHAVEYLTRTELGRATFLPLDALGARTGRELGELAERRGVIGYAHTLVRTKPEFTGAIAFLIGNVLIVDTLQTGIALVRETGLRDTVVPLSGEQILGGGAITGGRYKRERSILSRRVQATALREGLPQMRARLQEDEVAVAAAQTASERASAEREAAKHAASRKEIVLTQLRAELTSLGSEIERLQRESLLTGQRATALQAQAHEARRAQREFETSTEDVHNEEECARWEAELLDARERIAQAEAVRSATSTNAGNLRERAAALAAERDGTSTRLELLHAVTDRARHAHESMLAQVGQLVAEIDRAAEEVARLNELACASDVQLEQTRKERDRMNAQITALQSDARAAELEEREASVCGERLRMRLAEIEAELGMLVANFAQNPATESESMDVESRYAKDQSDVSVELPRLREDLARLSNVNLNSEADREEVAQREAFLREQMNDLTKARETLLEVIREIEASTQEQFNVTFNAVSAAFSEMFGRVFPGGEARMWQTNPNALSETGIEISVQPPGKKMMALAALSGGERAMTAAALIFALIKVRPSPFYLLDEVDAALDDANVERFSSMVRELAADGQMLIVTHNKKTMELANRMYGVTMAEPGISSVVSAALSEESRREPALV